MRYSQLIVFRRSGDTVRAIRVSTATAFGVKIEREVSFPSLYAGHCAWIGEQLRR
jgi:hypothetical protein